MSLQFFIADDGVHGQELYVTDGTGSGTKLLKDINPGLGSSSVGNQVQSNGILYFTAYDGAATHLWRTDGTGAGTYALTSSANGDSAGNLINVNGTLFFLGSDQVHGAGLFKSDGTVAGTSFVQTVTYPSQLTAVGGTLFFQAYDSTNGYELWKSDGTPAGTGLVKDINPGGNGSSLGNFTASGGKLFFTADNGTSGGELYVSDGTAAGTYQVKDINNGPGGSSPSNLFSAGNRLFFTADDAAHGRQLYTSDGTVGNATALPVAGYSTASFTRLNNGFYFVANDPSGGQAIFTSDGSTVTTLAHLNYLSGVFYNLGSQLVFYGDDGTHGGGLYTFNGTAATFVSSVSGGFSQPVVSAGKLFFVSSDAAHGSELWVYDGTSVHITADVNPGTYDTSVGNISAVQNGVVFTATRPDVGTELFFSDGTAGKTGLIDDVNATANHSPSLGFGSNFVAAGSVGYFAGNDGIHGNELWATDGTGAHQVQDLVVGATGSDPGSFYSVAGRIFFTANDGVHGRQLYTVDASGAEQRLTTNDVGGTPFDSSTYFLTINNSLYYFAYDASSIGGYAIYTSDGTSVTKVAHLDSYPGSSIKPLAFGSGYIFNATVGSNGGLYTLDATGLHFKTAVGDFESPTVSGGNLYFRAYDRGDGSELYVYDGTSIKLAANINPGVYDSSPANITGLGNGAAVFTAFNPSIGNEVYVADTSGNATLLKDVNATGNPAQSLGFGSNFVAAGSVGYFAGNDGIHGNELWATDGTGAHQVQDLVVGATGSDPGSFYSVAGRIFFTANDGVHGRQLYTVDASGAEQRLTTNDVGGTPFDSSTYFLTINNSLYYFAYDASSIGGYAIYTSDGTSVTKVAHLDSYPGSSIKPLAFGSGYIFNATVGSNGGLYTLDATGLHFKTAVGDFESPTVSGGNLYFRAYDRGDGSELYVYDGTSIKLAANINPGVYDSSPANITGLGNGAAVFTAFNPSIGNEVYVADTSGNATLLKDVNATGNPAQSLGFGSNFVAAGSVGYFAGNDGIHGNELWATDGTGAHQVQDLVVGATGSDPGSFYSVAGRIFFTANDGVHGRQLYTVDASGAEQRLTTNDVGGTPFDSSTYFLTINNSLYYFAYDASSIGGYAIYTSDGTSVTKVAHLDSYPGSSIKPLAFGSGYIFNATVGSNGGLYTLDATGLHFKTAVGDFESPTVSGGNLFYSSSDGGDGYELWVYDGTSAHEVAPLNPNGDSSPHSITSLGDGRVVFAANDGTTGNELYVSNGTSITSLGDIFPGATSSEPQNLTAVGNKVFFTANYFSNADGAHGRELWVTDGTSANTYMVKDINSGSGDSNPGSFFVLGGKLYFSAYDPAVGQNSLYVTDGARGGATTVVIGTGDASDDHNPGNFLSVGDGTHFYFTANGGIYYSDGTSAGTNVVASGYGFDASKYAIVGGQLLFQFYDGTNGFELWTSNGTSAGTHRVTDTQIPNSSDASGFTFVNTAAGARVFFVANDGTDGRELWVTDGTSANTYMVKDINSGSGDSNPGSFFVLGGKLYFSAYDPAVGQNSLYVTDGARGGATTVVIGTGDASDDHNPGNFLSVGDGTHFYFTANGGIYYSDGTSAGTNVVASGYGFDASKYAIVGGQLLFQFYDGTNGFELWTSNGTSAGTHRVTDTQIPNSSDASGFTFVNTAAGARVFFVANDGTDGRELWVTDGTSANTYMVKDINSGSGDSNPGSFFVLGGKLYFSAYDPAVGQNSLYVTDGARGGATTVVIGTGDASDDHNPGNFLSVGDGTHFYFTANGGIYYSDGTSAGTNVVASGYGFDASKYAIVGGQLLFQFYDGTNGFELWTSNGTSAGTHRVTDTQIPNSSNPTSFAAIDNLPPTVTGTAQTAIDDNQTTHPFQNTVIADPDLPAQTQTVTITPDDPAKGGFTAASLAASGFVGGGVDSSYTFTGTAAQATAAIQALVYQPVANRLVVGQSETIGFTLAVNDGAGGSVVNAATTVTQTSINDAPVGGNDTASVNEDATMTVATKAAGLLANDTDPDVGETATLKVTGAHAGTTGSDVALAASGKTDIAGTYGTLHLAADGTYDYTPNSAAAEALPQGVAASEVFTYTVADVHGAMGTATLTFAITGQEDAPVAVADAVSVDEDATAAATQRSAGLLGNDTDVDAGEQATLKVSGAFAGASGSDTAVAATGTTDIAGTYGTLHLAADGTYSYTPNNPAAEALAQGTVVTDAFGYTMVDAQNVASASTVTFTVTGQNDAPTAGANTATVNEDATAAASTRGTGLLANASDVDTGETATLKVSGAHAGTSGSDTAVAVTGMTDIIGTYGTLHLAADGTYSYSPNSTAAEALAQGTAASELFTYTVADVHGATTTATLTFAITGQEDAPVAVADNAVVNEDATASATTRGAGLLGNDTDADSGEQATLVVSGAHAGTSGADTAVTGTTDIAGTYGTLHLKADGTYSYTPGNAAAEALAQGAAASDVFSYTIRDAQGVTATSSLTFAITGQNDTPVAGNNTAAVIEDATVAASTRGAGLLGNASDVDTGETGSLVIAGAHAGTIGGDVAVAPSGTTTIHGTYGDLLLAADGTYSYTPNSAAAEALPQDTPATETFTYTVADIHGVTTTATLTLAITGQEDAPVAVADNVAVDEDATASAGTRGTGLLGNDTDVDTGEQATLTISGAHAGTSGGDTTVTSAGTDIAGTYGTLHLAADGTYSYTPNNPAAEALAQGAAATDTFSYTIRDAQNVAATSTVTFHITGQDDPAVARPDAVATDEATVLHGSVVVDNGSGADYDIDGPALTVASVNGSAALVGQTITLASGAKLTLQSNGQFAYDPNHQFDYLVGDAGAANTSATDSFTYALLNGGTATVTVTIAGVTTPGEHVQGTAGNDTITASSNSGEYFDLSQGGTDTVTAGAGNDAIVMGGALTAADHIDGGSGYDQVGLQGDYTGANALHLAATTLVNVETLVMLPGGGTPHSYDITWNDAILPAGQLFTVYATNLGSGENLTFDGSSETDGAFLFYGGAGTDILTGGAGDDAFYFGPDRFGPNDVVHGGGGRDQLGLDGHSGALTLDATHTDVETLALLNGPGDTYGTITVDDSWVVAGQTKTITALTSFHGFVGPVTSALVVDGSQSSHGNLNIYGGSAGDTLTGGAGADHIYGGLGADTLAGGAGADVFIYHDAAESTGTGFDMLTDFAFGSDKLQIDGQGADDYVSVSGKLDAASFDTDLQAAVAGQLSVGHAVFVTASSGSYAGQTFLVVEANGSAGYQSGGDYVFHMPAAPVNPTGPADFITH